MYQFDVGQFWASTELTIDLHGIAITIIPLDDEQKEDFKKLDDSKLMLDIAAKQGISYNNKRIIDDADRSKRISEFFAKLNGVDEELDPSMVEQLAFRIIDASGLMGDYDEQLELENSTIDGDDPELDLSATLGDLEQDAKDYPVTA